MLKELEKNPESGFLGYTVCLPVIVQYWRSFEQFEPYARAKDFAHWPAWLAFNKRVCGSRGDVGIWHETYRVAQGNSKPSYFRNLWKLAAGC